MGYGGDGEMLVKDSVNVASALCLNCQEHLKCWEFLTRLSSIA